MAGGAVIGALRVNLGIDSAQFQNGLKTAQSSISSFGKSVQTVMVAAAAAATAAIGALAVGIRNTINTADDMGKAAQKFGVAVEDLSRLKYAADLSGVSIEGLGTGLRKLSQNMQETANGAKNTASQAFAALGISVTDVDGKLKSSQMVIQEVAGKFALMENGATKTALAMAIFGRSGADLIPMLNAGADGIASMSAEADRLGIVIDSNTARAAEVFNDNITRLEAAKDGLILKITAHLLPALEDLSEQFVGFVNDEAAVRSAAESIGNSFAWVGKQVGRLVVDVQRARAEIVGLVNAAKLLGSGEFSAAISAFREGQQQSDDILGEYKKRVEDAASGLGQSQGQIQRRIDDAFGTAGTSGAEKFTANFEKAVKSGGAGRVKSAIDPLAREAAQIFEQTRTPAERYAAEIAKLDNLLAAGAISQDTYNRAVDQAQDSFDKATNGAKKSALSLEQVGQSIAGTVSNAFMGLIDGSMKLKDSLKGLLRQLASMALNNAFKILFSGGAGGAGATGGGGLFGGIFKGIGKLFGFANGGSFQVGGAGGIDSQLVAFKASPNERVSITKPGQDAGGGGRQIVIQQSFPISGAISSKDVQAMVQQGAARAVTEVRNQFPEWQMKIGRDGALA